MMLILLIVFTSIVSSYEVANAEIVTISLVVGGLALIGLGGLLAYSSATNQDIDDFGPVGDIFSTVKDIQTNVWGLLKVETKYFYYKLFNGVESVEPGEFSDLDTSIKDEVISNVNYVNQEGYIDYSTQIKYEVPKIQSETVKEFTTETNGINFVQPYASGSYYDLTETSTGIEGIIAYREIYNGTDYGDFNTKRSYIDFGTKSDSFYKLNNVGFSITTKSYINDFYYKSYGDYYYEYNIEHTLVNSQSEKYKVIFNFILRDDSADFIRNDIDYAYGSMKILQLVGSEYVELSTNGDSSTWDDDFRNNLGVTANIPSFDASNVFDYIDPLFIGVTSTNPSVCPDIKAPSIPLEPLLDTDIDSNDVGLYSDDIVTGLETVEDTFPVSVDNDLGGIVVEAPDTNVGEPDTGIDTIDYTGVLNDIANNTTSIEEQLQQLNQGTEIDLNNYNIPDLFKLLILILIALLKFFVTFVALVIAFRGIPPDSSLLPDETIQVLEWFKNTSLPSFNMSMSQIISYLVAILLVFRVARLLKRHIVGVAENTHRRSLKKTKSKK